MELIYASEKLKTLCTSAAAAKKLFHGDAVLGRSLLARINALNSAVTIFVKVVEITEVSSHYE